MVKPWDSAWLRIGGLFLAAAFACWLVAVSGRVAWAGDTHTFFNYAYGFSHPPLDPNLFWRTPGYPAIIWLSRANETGSLQWLILAQCAAGIAAPLLAYVALAPLSRPIALVTSSVMIASLIPFAMVEFIYHDQWLLAGSAVAVAALVRFACGGRALWLLLVVIPISLIEHMRANYVLLVAVLISIIVLFRREKWRAGLAAITAILAIHIAVGQWVQNSIQPQSALGRQLFFNAYLTSGGMAGPHTDALAQRMRPLLPEVDSLLRTPTRQGFQSLWVTSHSGGQLHEPWDRYFMAAAIEQAISHPDEYLGMIFRNYASIATGNPGKYRGAVLQDDPPGLPGLVGPVAPRTESLRTPIDARWWNEPQPGPGPLNTWFAVWFKILTPLSYVLMLIGVLGFARTSGPERAAAFTIFASHSVVALTIAISVAPILRYQLDLAPIAMMGASLGALYLVRRFRPPA